MEKEDVGHIHRAVLLSHQKERNNAICSNVNGPGDCHIEQHKSDREAEAPVDILSPHPFPLATINSFLSL